ncbi:MAG: hypothetical protein ACI8UG_002796 [Gammaproteobacteria bacterium]|jgi:hypothetical protein
MASVKAPLDSLTATFTDPPIKTMEWNEMEHNKIDMIAISNLELNDMQLALLC